MIANLRAEVTKLEEEEKELKKSEKDLESKENMLMQHDKVHQSHLEKMEKGNENWGEGHHAHNVPQHPLAKHNGFQHG